MLERAGYQAVRISGSGELAPDPPSRQPIDQTRYGNLATGTLRLVSALDATDRQPAHGPATYLVISGQVLPGWALRALAVALLLPPLATSIDALARARRRRERIGGWFVWLLAGVLAFAFAFACGKLFSFSGLGPPAPPAPPDPGAVSIGARAALAIAVTLAGGALGWLIVRPTLIRSAGRLPSPAAGGAGCAIAVTLSSVAMATAFVNPFAAIAIAATAHLWMLCTLLDLRPRFALALALLAVVPLAALALYYLVRLSLDPLSGLYYLYLLVVGGHVDAAAILVASIIAGGGASVLAVLRARARSDASVAAVARAQPILGPGGHAGPGSLGSDAGSALRR